MQQRARPDTVAAVISMHQQYTLHTAHCTLHTPLFTLPTSHCTLHAVHSLHNTHNTTLLNARCTLHNSHYQHLTAHCTLHTAHITHHISHFTLPTSLFTPYTTHTGTCLEVEIRGGERHGEIHYLPRLILTAKSTTLPFCLQRIQFPLQPCFAM